MNSTRPVVCVVDDDASLLRALKRLLGAAGFAVEPFASAEEFLERAHPAKPECLVLDVRLGGMSGFELQDRLVACGASIPIIFITAHDDAATRERARKAGALAYLRKPFDDQALLAAIRKATDRR